MAGSPHPVAYVERAPAPTLAPFVRCYWQLRGVTGEGGMLRRVLPDGCADVLFELGDSSRLLGGTHAAARWVGTMTRAVVVQSTGWVDMFGVRFAPGGLAALAGMALHPLTDAQVALADLDPLALGCLTEPVALAPSFAARAELVDAALGRALGKGVSLPSIARLLARVAAAHDVPSVAGLEVISGYGARTLERQFSDALGVTPKQYLRLLRFERARELLYTGKAGAEVATLAGYADQAHLVREVRRIAGLRPGELVRERPP
jgi:AraC-like DNA-binding protein